MTEFMDGLDDAMPTIPKDELDRTVAKAIEAHAPATPKRPEYTDRMEEVMIDNMLTGDDRGAEEPDMVVLPAHYARFKIEPIRFLVENFGPVILVGKVVKYTMRYDAKNGQQDLAKAKRCLEMLQKYTQGDPDWWKR